MDNSSLNDRKLLIELHYLPCIDYFACLLAHPQTDIEAHENYLKQTYRNRCYIRSSQTIDRLTVPVIQGAKKQLYTAVKIDYSKPWIAQHIRTIHTAYAKAPYFEYLAPQFEATLQHGYIYLFELNLAILKLCLQLLGMQNTLQLTEQYLPSPNPDACIIKDARNQLIPSKRQDQPIYHQPFVYQQVFGTIFTPNLSMVDLLFCEGANAYHLLKKHSISYSANA